MTNTTRAAIGAIITAAALAITVAPPAQAFATAVTVVTFGGTDCIQTQGASISNPYRMSRPTWQCSGSGSLVFNETRPRGALVGVDPIMGNADWIGCTINDGWNSYSDFATRGDGTDVNCLRTAN